LKPLNEEDQVEELTSATGDDVSDAFQTISVTTAYINNADAKAGFGAAAIAAIVIAISQQSSTLGVVLGADTTIEQWARIVLILLAIAMLFTVVGIGLTLIPRTPEVTKGGRFSFPTVAGEHWRFTPANRAAAANEAWAESQTLARIAKRKFSGMRISLWSLGAAFTFFGCWTVLASRIS
jgi:hypothetical protein